MLSFFKKSLSDSFSNLTLAIANSASFFSTSQPSTVLIDMVKYLRLKEAAKENQIYTRHFVNLFNYLKHYKDTDLKSIDIEEKFPLPHVDGSLADNTYIKSFQFIAENLDDVKNYVEDLYNHLNDNQGYIPYYNTLLDDLRFEYSKNYSSSQNNLSTSSAANATLSSPSPVASLAAPHFPSITDNPSAPTVLDGLMILARARRICVSSRSPLSLPLNEFEDELRQITITFLQTEFTELEQEVNKRRSLPTANVPEPTLDLSASVLNILTPDQLNLLKNESQKDTNPFQQYKFIEVNTKLSFEDLYSKNIQKAKEITGTILQQDFNNTINMVDSVNITAIVPTNELRWETLDKKYLSTKINTQHFDTIKNKIIESEVGKIISPCYISLYTGLYVMNENAKSYQFNAQETCEFFNLLRKYAIQNQLYKTYGDAIARITYFQNIKPFFTFSANEFINLATNQKSLLSIYIEKLNAHLLQTGMITLSEFLPKANDIQNLAVKVIEDPNTEQKYKENLKLYNERVYHHSQRSARLELCLNELLKNYKNIEEAALLTYDEKVEFEELTKLILNFKKLNPITNLIQSVYMFIKKIDTLQNQPSKSSSNENILSWIDEQPSTAISPNKFSNNFFILANIKIALNDIIVSKHEKSTPDYEPLVNNLLIVLNQFKNKSSNNQVDFFTSQAMKLINEMFNYYEEKYFSMFNKKWNEASNLRQTMG